MPRIHPAPLPPFEREPDPGLQRPVSVAALYDAPGAAEGIPIGDYVAALRRYWWLMLVTTVLALGVAAWRLSREVPMYAAGASVRLVNARQEIVGNLANPASDGWSGYYTDPILSQIQLLRSRAVAADVVDSLGLRLRPERPEFPQRVLQGVQVEHSQRPDTLRLEFGPAGVRARTSTARAQARFGEPFAVGGVRMTVTGPPGVSSALFRIVPHEQAVHEIQGGVQAQPRELTNVIDISYTSYDPYLATRVVNAAAHSFQALNAESAKQRSRRRRIFLREQLRSTDSMLVEAQFALSGFRKGVQAFSSREKFAATQEGLTNLTLRRDEVEQERRVYTALAAQLAAGRGRGGDEEVAALAASPQISNNVGILRLHEQLIRYQTARDSLTSGPWSTAQAHPDVQRIDSLIVSARGRLVRAVAARTAALASQIAVMDRVLASDAARMRVLPDAEAEEARLTGQVSTLQKLVDDLLLEQQRARMDEAVESGQVEIVDEAVVPGGPLGTGTRRRFLFALLAGLALGGAGAVVLDRMNSALVRREDVEESLGLPALAVIPRIGDGGRPTARKVLSRRMQLPPDPAASLVTVTDQHSASSQAYRKLRTHLIFSGGGSRPRMLMVTSAAAAEGKSTVSSNLAVTFAQQGLRVVLVDCDLRRARLHTLFEVTRVPGVTDVLQGNVSVEEVTRPSKVEGLSIVPSGKLVPDASELLGGAVMTRMLSDLAAAFDLVLVDTPPVLAAADAEILGVQVDAVLLVVRAGKTERQSAQYAVRQLRALGARMVGVVLNDPDQKVQNYGRYGYYYDYYGHPPEEGE